MATFIDPMWRDVDDFIERHLIPQDPILQHTLQHTEQQGLPAQLHVAPNQGQFLAMLIQMNRCRTVLELGTFAAYSTLWMAKALPKDGYLLTIEGRENHYQLALENIRHADLPVHIDARLGKASDVLRQLDEQTPSFDFVFIDADKRRYPEYLELCLPHTHSGSVIVLDNVVRAGAIVNQDNHNPTIEGIRQVFTLLENHPQIDRVTALQTVGCKGHDGFAIAIVK